MEPLFENKKKLHFKVSKSYEKILDVYNDVFYGPAKLQAKIVCIPTYRKIANPEKYENFRI